MPKNVQVLRGRYSLLLADEAEPLLEEPSPFVEAERSLSVDRLPSAWVDRERVRNVEKSWVDEAEAGAAGWGRRACRHEA